MGGDGGSSAAYAQTETWNTLNFQQSLKSSALQQQSLALQQQSQNISAEGLELQKQSQALTQEANEMQKESLSVAKQQAETSQESLAVAKQQAETAKTSQALQKAQITEPEKKVNLAKSAADATARAQALRNGLGSTFSRSGFGLGSSTAATSSATAGKATKLGG